MGNRMTSGPSQGVFLFVVQQRALRFMRRLVRLVGTLMSRMCLAVLRTIITGVVFTTCVMVMLYYLGVPVPGPSGLIDKFESLGQLANILS
jgi:hypothetical protein